MKKLDFAKAKEFWRKCWCSSRRQTGKEREMKSKKKKPHCVFREETGTEVTITRERWESWSEEQGVMAYPEGLIIF